MYKVGKPVPVDVYDTGDPVNFYPVSDADTDTPDTSFPMYRYRVDAERCAREYNRYEGMRCGTP